MNEARTSVAGKRLPGLLGSALLLAGCASAPTSAPVIERAPPLKVAPPLAPVAKPVPVAPGGTYTVRRGDTLFSIALEHGVDYRDLARWNGLSDPSRIGVGQVLHLGPDAPGTAAVALPKPAAEPGVQVGGARARNVPDARPLGAGSAAAQGQGDGSMKTTPKALRLPYSAENVALLARPAAPSAGSAPTKASTPADKPAAAVATSTAPAGAAPPAASDAPSFIWPIKGRVIAGFSEPNNKGVDIGGQLGDPVVAAAPGRVMYTGTGIRGYGKLIVIKHEDGYNSVYAHNSNILVKEGQTVARGEKIAEVGDTDADRPKLHFEIRKSGKPVDPLKYLSGERS